MSVRAVRDLSAPSNSGARHGESVAIGTTWVPEHMRRDEESRESEYLQGYMDISSNFHPLARHASTDARRDGSNRPNGSHAKEMMGNPSSVAVFHSDAENQSEGTKEHDDDDKDAEVDARPFLRGWDLADSEINGMSQERCYGFEQMNERED